MEINVADNFTLLFDKNSNTAYKALQKECEKSDKAVLQNWKIGICEGGYCRLLCPIFL